MKRKTSITEVLGYILAFVTLFAALPTAVFVVGSNFNAKLGFLSLVLLAEAVLVFVGLIKMNPTCMRVVKWINIVKCALIVIFYIKNFQSDLTQTNSTNFIAKYLYFATFAVCVAHNLDQFYMDLRKSRLEVVSVTETVSAGPASTSTSVQQAIVKRPARMQRKTSITEGFGYFLAFVGLVMQVDNIRLLAVAHFNYGFNIEVVHVLQLILLWMEPALMFVGVIKMEPVCMRVIISLFIAHCFVGVQTLIIFWIDKHNLQQTNSAQRSEMVGYAAIFLVFEILVVCVAYRLNKFYTNRLNNRPVLVTGIVSEGSGSTRSVALVQQELLSMTSTVNQGATDLTAGTAQPQLV